MTNFHGDYKNRHYFEGWYLKHQKGNQTLALIPAFHIDKEGKRSASIQVITNTDSYQFLFPVEQFCVDRKKFRLKIGENTFSEKGCTISLKSRNYSVAGRLYYSRFQPLHGNIMGPFAIIPFMQCNHGIVSLSHKLLGYFIVNGKLINFNNGTGYIEKDWGTSFPSSYFWTQCSNFYGKNSCVMLSVADIPFLGTHFKGCICSIAYQGRQYRLATYRGAKVIQYSKKYVEIVQGKYRFTATFLGQKGHPLSAPSFGSMSRTIHENPSCTVRYRFYKKGILLFDITRDKAGFEFAK